MHDILDKLPVPIQVISKGNNSNFSASAYREIDKWVGSERLSQSNRRCIVREKEKSIVTCENRNALTELTFY